MTTMFVDCHIDGCRCRHPLFNIEQGHGVVETKCPRCRQIHTFEYGSTSEATADVRCDNSFKGKGMGGWCGQLVARISSDFSGSFGYRCPRCKDSKTIRIQTPVLVST